MSIHRYKGQGIWQTTGRYNNTMAQTALSQSSGLPTITLGGYSPSVSLSNSAQSWANITLSDFGEDRHEYLKKYEVYESNEPLITLSVAANRLMRTTSVHYKLTDGPLFSKVTHEDRLMADQIKDYYSKKVMMWKLKGNGSLSPFRDDMNKLVHSDGLTFRESMIGIAYWLPHFYEYDIEMDIIKSNLTTNQTFDQMNKDGKPGVLRITEELVPIKRLERKTKRSKTLEYWFNDTRYNAGVVIRLEEKNQLQHLWDTMFDKKEPMKIQGTYARRKLDDFEYYSVTNWSLA